MLRFAKAWSLPRHAPLSSQWPAVGIEGMTLYFCKASSVALMRSDWSGNLSFRGGPRFRPDHTVRFSPSSRSMVICQ